MSGDGRQGRSLVHRSYSHYRDERGREVLSSSPLMCGPVIPTHPEALEMWKQIKKAEKR